MGRNLKDIMRRTNQAEARARHIETHTQTVFGIYRPSDFMPIHVKNIKRVGRRWVETSEPHTVTIPEVMEPVLTRPKRFIVIIGGRGSGKSESVGRIVNADVDDYAAKVLNLREFQSSIKDSVYPLLKACAEKQGIEGLEFLRDEIRHANGGGHRFKGMARDPDGVKSAFGFTRFWGEESQTFSADSLRKLTPTMREEDGRMIFTANPGSSEDPFSQRFIVPFLHELDAKGIYEDDLHLVIKVNYDKNPWFPEALRAEMEFDRKTLSRALFDHIWHGAFNDSVEDAIIPAEWFDAAIDAHKKMGWKPSGARIAALDPADVGKDNKAYIERHGSVVCYAQSWYDGDANDSADKAITWAKAHGVNMFLWDGSGLGAALRRDITTAYKDTAVLVDEYKAGEGVKNPEAPVELDNWLNKEAEGRNTRKNKDQFGDRGSQDIYLLRRRFEKTYRAIEHGEYSNPDELISLDSEGIGEFMAQLRAELCRIPRIYDNNGKFRRMPKKQMREKLKIRSPGMADSLIMTMQPPKPQIRPDYSNLRVPSNR